jgi:hypothetical protein
LVRRDDSAGFDSRRNAVVLLEQSGFQRDTIIFE